MIQIFGIKGRIYPESGLQNKNLIMDNHNPSEGAYIPKSLSTFNTDQLADLLSHKRRLLTVASIAGIIDKDYIYSLTEEIEAVQEELNSRNNLRAV